MTLEDFFTLTEMNNGLLAPSRVRELVDVMQKERDSIVKNVGDSIRQWSAVASAIAATENKDCLDLFIELDGLQFICKWLKDVQNFSNDTSGSVVEESITHLLRAVEKLHLDHEKLVDSEIWTAVKDLLVHNSPKVQDKARLLFESWEKKRDGDASRSDDVESGALIDNDEGNTTNIYASLHKVTSVKETEDEVNGDDPVLSTKSDVVQPSHQIGSTQNSDKNSYPSTEDERPSDHVGSPTSEKTALEPPVCHSIGTTLVESCNSAISRQENIGSRTESHDLESPSKKQSSNTERTPEKAGSLEDSKTSDDKQYLSSYDAADAMKSVTDSPKKFTIEDKISSNRDALYIDSKTADFDGMSVLGGSGYAKQHKSSSTFDAKEGGSFNHHLLRKSSGSEKSWGSPKDLGAFLSGIEHGRKGNTLDLHARDDKLANSYDFSKKHLDREPDGTSKKTDNELDYGIVDPLEVARQVAIEVEREVVDHREHSCSSSEKQPEGNELQPGSPDSVSGKQSNASKGSTKESENDPDLSDETSSQSATSSENQDAEETNGTQEMATSQVTEAAQEEPNTEKGSMCSFDLNQEISSEETDRLGNQFSAPVSVVSASRAAAAPGLPDAPLHFGGNLGWKGSAATSAFRPASPRLRMPETDKYLSTGGSSSSSKQQQQGFLEFDLNVAEGIEAPESSSLPSGESWHSRRSEHLGLDLNHASEDGGGGTSDLKIGQFFPLGNSHQSQSSSSSKRPLTNFDLNDQATSLNQISDTPFLSRLSQNFAVPGGMRSGDSAISIMGTRVEVSRQDFVPQTLPIPNGRAPELSFDVNNLGRTGNFLGIGNVLPYAPYGYNNIAPGPSMPYPSTVYGSGGPPIPYMVDSRGAPVFPQIVGSASAIPNAFSQQLPFSMSMNNSIPSNGVGPSRSSFDLNSGMMVGSGSGSGTGSKDPSGLGLFLNSSHVRSMEEQQRSNSQPTVTPVGGKRKEPENGWENYPFKHITPPWK